MAQNASPTGISAAMYAHLPFPPIEKPPDEQKLIGWFLLHQSVFSSAVQPS